MKKLLEPCSGSNFKEDMDMRSLPVYIDGKSCGELNINQDGLMSVFTAAGKAHFWEQCSQTVRGSL